jgi:condensin complex subunit 1
MHFNLSVTIALNCRFGVAEQAINAIYLLASQPDILCSGIVREKTKKVFSKQTDHASQKSAESSGHAEDTSQSFRGLSSVRSLSQLLFIVGHVASEIPVAKHAKLSVKQIIHIEVCEAEFKRKKAQLEKGTRSSIGS